MALNIVPAAVRQTGLSLTGSFTAVDLASKPPPTCRDLVAYWQFEDSTEFEDGGISKPHLVAHDSSGKGNHLPLVTPPKAADVVVLAPVRWCL